MQTNVDPTGKSARTRRLIGWIVSGLVSALLVFSAFLHIQNGPEVVAAFSAMRLTDHRMTIVIIKLVSVALYLIPRTSQLGTFLLTGYFGGATVIHMTVGEPVVSPLVIGAVVWLGNWLRNPDMFGPLTRGKSI